MLQNKYLQVAILATSLVCASCAPLDKPSNSGGFKQVDPKIYSNQTLSSIKRITKEDLFTLIGRGIKVRYLCARYGNPEGVAGVEEFDLENSIFKFDAGKDDYLVTVCDCVGDHGAIMLASYLISKGYRNVYPLTGGYKTLAEVRKL